MSATSKLSFKRLTPETERQKAAEASNREVGSHFQLFKKDILPYKFENGRNVLRLLPQPAHSKYDWFTEVWVLSFFNKSSHVRGVFRITDTSINGDYAKVRKLLRSRADWADRMWSPKNEDGISLNAKPKTVFLGFDVNADIKKVVPIVLPATVPWERRDGLPRKPQAGTRIAAFATEENIHGQPRYGHIADLLEGRAIIVDVSGAGSVQAQYDPSVDDKFPLCDNDYNIKPEYEELLKQVKPFDEILSEPTREDFVKLLKSYLPEDMFEYVAKEMHYEDVDTSGIPSGPEPAEKAAAGKNVPLPDDETNSAQAAAERALREMRKTLDKRA
jgi:hypothetical protein